MNDALHYSQRLNETVPSIELREKPVTNCVTARAKLENIGLYFDHARATAHLASEFINCLGCFYELATPQLAEKEIDARLFAEGEATTPRDVLGAMDVELARWQRDGIVTSQIEPLLDFSSALTEMEYAILDDGALDEGIRRRIQRDVYGSHL